MDVFLAGRIFLIAYGLMASERVDRTLVALPLRRGQVDRRADEARALREALSGVAFFMGVVLINGILAVLLIARMQAPGRWGRTAVDVSSIEGIDEVRPNLQLLTHSTSAPVR